MTSGKGVDDLINTLIKKNFKKISSLTFSPPVVGSLVKKGLKNGESRAPQTPPPPGTPMNWVQH